MLSKLEFEMGEMDMMKSVLEILLKCANLSVFTLGFDVTQ